MYEYCLTNRLRLNLRYDFQQKLQLETTVPLELCRLVLYNSHNGAVERTLEGRENEEIGTILSTLCRNRKYEMLMEIRHKDKPFPAFKAECECSVCVLLFTVASA